jgi:hypothetical protein
LIEGVLKADIVHAKTGLATLGVPGVDMWRLAIDLAKELGANTIRVAFDADARTNQAVARCLLECLRGLRAAGFAVELETWDIADGKGLDDLLVAGKQPKVLAGDDVLATAIEIAKAAGVDPDEQPRSSEQPQAGGEVDGAKLIEEVETELGKSGPTGFFLNKPPLEKIADAAVRDPAIYGAAKAAATAGGVKSREFDKAIKPIAMEIAENIVRTSRGATGGFFESDGCICRRKFTMQGVDHIPLCNFTCRITGETVRDDGAEKRIMYTITGNLHNLRSLPEVEVAAGKFDGLGWVAEAWGSDAVVWGNEKKILPSAIQGLSRVDNKGNPIAKPRRHVFEHTGWRKFDDHWCYLCADGAIFAKPQPKERRPSVELQPPLSNCQLPVTPDGHYLIAAIRASLQLLMLSPKSIAFPVLAGVYRSVLSPCDFSLHLVGQTGIFKSELAALAQQHFGAGFDARHLPGSWTSTANSLERLAFLAKEMLLVVDDFAPQGSSADVQRYHRDADRLFRGQGNNAGRQRMRHDGTLRLPNPPRGLILSTGEDIARGQSVRSRQLILELSQGDIDAAKLTVCQQHAAEGLYAASMFWFIRWVAGRYDAIKNELGGRVEALRDEAAADGQHARTPSIVAQLAVGFRYFLDFAVDAGAINAGERQELDRQCMTGLLDAAGAQAAHQEQCNPAKQFVRLLSSGFATGRMHLATEDGSPPPESPATWGWRSVSSSGGWKASYECRATGKQVGWLIDGNVYLDLEASYAEAQGFAAEQGDSFAVQKATLTKRLHEQGMLVACEEARETRTVRKMINGRRISVLHIRSDALSVPVESPTNPTTEAETNGEESGFGDRADGPVQQADDHDERECGRVFGRVGQFDFENPTTKNSENTEENNRLVGLVGLVTKGERCSRENNNDAFTFDGAMN